VTALTDTVTARRGPALTALTLGDPVDLWRELGFTVEQQCVIVDGVALRLGSAEPGISGWSLDVVAPGRGSRHVPEPTIAATPTLETTHRNGITGVDHVVLMVGDLDAARSDLVGLGLEVRRERAVVLGGRPVVQMFAWVGPAILEVVGPQEPTGDRSHLWGITFVAADLGTTAATLGPYAGSIRDAKQAGRHIMSVDTRSGGGSVRLTVMSPHRP
jgi:catechol 2,3-dioxygenase-like lactoylglutathione lyase family enzyme